MNESRIVFEHWVEQQATISHRKMTGKMDSAVNARLQDGFTVNEIKEAIDNFNEAITSDDYFWTYDNWTLDEFLSRGEGSKMEKFLKNLEGFRKDKQNDSPSNAHDSDTDYSEVLGF